ncbi:hypothetical protein ACJX0J_039323, partial [Zea mays]
MCRAQLIGQDMEDMNELKIKIKSRHHLHANVTNLHSKVRRHIKYRSSALFFLALFWNEEIDTALHPFSLQNDCAPCIRKWTLESHTASGTTL